jgi:hypothetical protein
MGSLTSEEKRRIDKYLSEASSYEKESALESRQGFFSWLKKVGLGYIVAKFIDMAWAAIKAFFFL